MAYNIKCDNYIYDVCMRYSILCKLKSYFILDKNVKLLLKMWFYNFIISYFENEKNA